MIRIVHFYLELADVSDAGVIGGRFPDDQFLVGRPGDGKRSGLTPQDDGQNDHHRDEPAFGEPDRARAGQKKQHERRDDEKPGERRLVQRADGHEQPDAGETAGDIHRVRADGPGLLVHEAAKQPANRDEDVPDQTGHQECQGQSQGNRENRLSAGRAAPDIPDHKVVEYGEQGTDGFQDLARGGNCDEPNEHQQRHEDSSHRNRAPRRETAHAEAEHADHQDGILQVREYPDFRADPADQHHLQKQSENADDKNLPQSTPTVLETVVGLFCRRRLG